AGLEHALGALVGAADHGDTELALAQLAGRDVGEELRVRGDGVVHRFLGRLERPPRRTSAARRQSRGSAGAPGLAARQPQPPPGSSPGPPASAPGCSSPPSGRGPASGCSPPPSGAPGPASAPVL